MRNPYVYLNNFRAVFTPRKPRNPLLRLGLGLLGLVILAGLLFVLSVYYFPTGVVGRLRSAHSLAKANR